MAVWRRAAQGLALPAWTCTWARAVKVGMKRLGWTGNPSPWVWTRGDVAVALDPRRSEFRPCKDQLAHLVREVWRRSLFAKWQARGRTDSLECRRAVYTEAQCKTARSWALVSRNHFTVLSGATYSPAKRNVQASRQERLCSFCQHQLGTWRHVAWECPAYPPSLPMPVQPLLRRLGWGDEKVLQYLCTVRTRLLEVQRRSRAQPAPD